MTKKTIFGFLLLFFSIINILSQQTLLKIHISCDSLDLWGPKGIYSNPDSGGINWEKPCNVKIYQKDSLLISFKCGIRIQGASSVGMPKKSFRLFFRTEYGLGKLKYPVFGPDKLSSFDKIVFKAGYDDDLTTTSGTLMRDALSVELWNRAAGIPQLSRWVTLYLNGKYWGLYNMRESTDEHFVKAHTGLQKFDMIRFKNEGPDLVYGSMLEWLDLFDFIKKTDFSEITNFNLAEDKIDMTNFIMLMAFVQCSEYYSWAWGSSMYKSHEDNARWRFSIWDTDRAYTKTSWDGFDELENQTGSYKWANNFYSHLSESPEFRSQLFAAINDLQNTVFKPDFAVAILDSIYQIIKSEIPAEISRWNPNNTSFEENVANVRKFLKNRRFVLNQQLNEKFKVDTNKLELFLNVSGHGHIRLNVTDIYQYPWRGLYFTNKIKLVAVPDSGYHFTSWNIAPEHKSNYFDFDLTGASSITASFEEGIDTTSISYNDIVDCKIFPNPFSDKLSVHFYLNKNDHIQIKLIATDGRTIRTLKNGVEDAGFIQQEYSLHDIPKGTYMLLLYKNNVVWTRKTILKN